MKDTLITAKRKKTELITLLICFIIANLANLYSIITYSTKYVELFTSLGYVAVGTVVIYLLWSLIRLIAYAISLPLRKKSTQ